ncbi:MAG: Clp protease N-terminal domain-containing protein [Friedmanniella sp.]
MNPTIPSVGLDDLIAAVTSAHESALDRLERAVLLAAHLDEVADRLIGHFVDQARRSGASWTEIGASMGVTKQAVQKRFSTKPTTSLDPSQGFSSFTDQARGAVVSAQELARAAGNGGITVGHLVLGLISDPGCGAATSMAAQGLDLALLARTARATLPSPVAEVPALIPFDQHARDALERAFGVAQRLGHDRVGTEHMVLAILEVEDGTGVLAGLGLDPRGVEAGIGEHPR